eukprot:6283763-Pyramimonas_sp.AAC.1
MSPPSAYISPLCRQAVRAARYGSRLIWSTSTSSARYLGRVLCDEQRVHLGVDVVASMALPVSVLELNGSSLNLCTEHCPLVVRERNMGVRRERAVVFKKSGGAMAASKAFT